MNERINLIPEEYASDSGTGKVKRTLSSWVNFMAIGLVLSIVVLVGLVFFYSTQNSKLEKEVDSYKKQVSLLDNSEQRLILAKDRIEKIKTIQKLNNAAKEVDTFRQLSENLPPEIIFSEVNADVNKLETSAAISDNNFLSIFFDYLYNNVDANKIVLSALSYSPGSGYVANLIFNVEAKGDGK